MDPQAIKNLKSGESYFIHVYENVIMKSIPFDYYPEFTASPE